MKDFNFSPDSNMEDLRKLREYNSLRHIEMTTEEIRAELEESTIEFERLVNEKRKEKELVTS